jgi:signal transduction histidine kinase
VSEIMRTVDGPPSTRVESSFLRVRWVLWLLIVPVAWSEGAGKSFPTLLAIWLLAVLFLNFLTAAILRYAPEVTPHLPVVTLILDTILFGGLPLITNTGGGVLALFALFPSIGAALRFGPQMGLFVAGLVTLAIEIRVSQALVAREDSAAPFAGLPVAALLFSVALLVGYLSKHEKEAAVKEAASELEELRHAMAGARLLYETTDALSSTVSYASILDAMLEAGVRGLPPGRHEDGPSVGIALLFDDDDVDKRMRVIASRHLDRRDMERLIPAKEGIVANTLQTSVPTVFENISEDPELSAFFALRRCKAGVCYPLQAGLEQYGVVVLATPAPRRPATPHFELMRAFTNQAAVAFQNARLYNDLRAEHDQVIRSENEMRQKLARDLHDGPTQKVAALVMQLDYITRLLDQNPTEARAELQKAREVAQQTVKEIRTSLFALRPLALETKGLSAALQQYCERLREAEKVEINIDPGQFGSELDSNVAATVFAIIDEAVNNARKHASGYPIFVRVAKQNSSLVATIQDRGPGFDVDQVLGSYEDRSSLGLQNMRDRAKLIDGELRIESERGRGTRVTLVVPLKLVAASGTNP